MTIDTNRGFSRSYCGNKISRFSTNPAEFIGIYLKRKFAEATLQNAAPQKQNLSGLNLACKWVRDPATGHMECFWQKTISDREALYV